MLTRQVETIRRHKGGNIGINTSFPSYTLHTNGTSYAVTRTGGGIDIAEYILDTKSDTEAGDVLAADPDNAEVHYNLAMLYESDDDLELAFSHYQKFIEFSPPHHHELVKKVREHLFHLAGKSALRETKGKSDSKKK